MKLLTATIWYFSLGSLGFLLAYNVAGVPPDSVHDLYYFFEAAKDFLFVLSFFFLTKKDIEQIKAGKYAYMLWPAGIYFAIRLIWAIIKPLTNLEEEDPSMVMTVFTALVTGVIIFLVVDLRKRAREL